jgi:putative transposase
LIRPRIPTNTRPNQVWCADVTYIPMRRGFLYLVAIMDWATRTVLAWRLSNTMEADFCIEALEEALALFGPPEIINTDQGSQFPSWAWTDRLRQAGVKISMDGKGRFLDNIFVERLWRLLKYECVYLLPWRVAPRPEPASGGGSSSATPGAPTPLLAAGPRPPHTGSEERWSNPTGRPNP